MARSGVELSGVEDAEAALGAMVASAGEAGSCGGPWGHEVTPVVKYCGVTVAGRGPVLLVNPAWLRELVARDELVVLVDEMRTWFMIDRAVSGGDARPAA